MANPTKTQELEIRKVGDEVLVHDPALGKVHVLNATAGAVLEMCDGARSAEEIARSLCDATGTDTVVARDVEAILREFGALRLLVS